MESILAFINTFLSQGIDEIVIDLIFVFAPLVIVFIFIDGIRVSYQNNVIGNFKAVRREKKSVLLAINVPRETEQTPKAVENIFATLAGSKSSVTFKEKWVDGKIQPILSFEIVSNGGRIQFYIWIMDKKVRDLMEAAIYAQYGDAEIYEVQDDYVNGLPDEYPNDTHQLFGSEFFVSKDTHFPLKTYIDFEDPASKERLKDPLVTLLEAMAKMRPGEWLCVQILVQALDEQDWKDGAKDYLNEAFGVEKKKKSPGILSSAVSMLGDIPTTAISDITGIDLFGGGEDKKEDDPWKSFRMHPGDKAKYEAVARKMTKIGFGTKIRWFYVAPHDIFSQGPRVAMMKGVFQQYTNLDMNKFSIHGKATTKDDYWWQRLVINKRRNKLIRAYKKRDDYTGAAKSILNTEELATLWHFPAVHLQAPVVQHVEAKRAEPPSNLPTANEIVSGYARRATGSEFEKEESGQAIEKDAFELALERAQKPAPKKEATQPTPKPAAPVQTSSAAGLPEPNLVAPTQSAPEAAQTSPEPAQPSEPIQEVDASALAGPSIPNANSAVPAPESTQSKPKPKKEIPEAMRVLLEPGVEPEDVGIEFPSDTKIN